MKKLNRISHFTLAAALCLGGTAAMAQYTGPANSPGYISVSDVLKNPVDDKKVTLTGHIIRKIGHETYIFSDGTGEIQLDLDDDDLPRAAFDDKTRVRIFGEVDKDRRGLEIDVDSVQIVN